MKDIDEPLPPQSPDPEETDAASDGATDVMAGALFAGTGALALYIGKSYPAGTAFDMGPGYLPRIVACGLVAVGLVAIVRGVLLRTWAMPEFPVRAMLWIGGAILLFALLVERTGLFVACLASVSLATGADPQVRWREVPVVALLFSGFCALLFGYVLKLPIQVWPV